MADYGGRAGQKNMTRRGAEVHRSTGSRCVDEGSGQENFEIFLLTDLKGFFSMPRQYG